MNWISFYEKNNPHLRLEQLRRIYPEDSHFSIKKSTNESYIQKKEIESRNEKRFVRKNVCKECNLVHAGEC